MTTLRHLFLTTVCTLTLSACAQSKFTALEQQQISIEDAKLFEKSQAFTIDFAAMRTKDYSFPLPVGKAKMGKDYNVEIETKKGDAVKAMFDGTVRLSKNNPPFCKFIVIRHDNWLE
ncbi:MAG: M23 family metallopeptidase, partial [Prevotella sp.]|nr:M23 family metallopeptidase [Prevotella sp.]